MISDLFHDAHVWIALSFVIFAIVATALGRKPVLARLDGRIALARREIDTASQLRREAQELLDTYMHKQHEAAEEAVRLVAEAKRHAEQIRAQGLRELDETMQRREKLLAERLARMQDDALQDIKAYASTLVVKATTGLIGDYMDEAIASRLIDQSANRLNGRLA